MDWLRNTKNSDEMMFIKTMREYAQFFVIGFVGINHDVVSYDKKIQNFKIRESYPKKSEQEDNVGVLPLHYTLKPQTAFEQLELKIGQNGQLFY